MRMFRCGVKECNIIPMVGLNGMWHSRRELQPLPTFLLQPHFLGTPRVR